MKDLGITKGEWEFKPIKESNGWTDVRLKGKDHSIATCYMGRSNKDLEELNANAILIADAGTTANKCGLLPSEVLKQRDDVLDKLKDMSKYIRRELTIVHEAPEKEVKLILDGSEELIQSIEKPTQQ